ncbi:hypothetical protein GR140_30860 (plasmid) [Pseudomonas putida]|uniref:hypothetical protein n=1 Tax=Pseudomonas putida TaxID=303 RepID=UPI001BAE5A3C|nr:hypothetical protein [Pseudomonas putida]QUG93163.1 hypothetical protein GR140_30860 [Pseudomonas putida]
MATEWPSADCLCIFCAGIVAVCTGTRSHGVCSCGFCCNQIQASFGVTEQDRLDELDEQDRIAEFVESELEREIWMAEADWLSLVEFLSLLPNRPSSATASG